MTLTIDLTPQEEALLSTEAVRNGLDLATYVRSLVVAPIAAEAEVGAEAGSSHFYFTASTEEFNRALDEIAEMNRGLPVLPAEAYSRESIYGEY